LKIGGYEGFGSFVTNGEHHFAVNLGLMAAGVFLALSGFGLGYAIYVRKAISSEKLMARFRPLHTLLVNKYYMDALYQRLINHVVVNTPATKVVLSKFVGEFDRRVINDVGVNGPGIVVKQAGFRSRYLESGLLYNYALAMVFGAIAVGLFWWLVIPKMI